MSNTQSPKQEWGLTFAGGGGVGGVGVYLVNSCALGSSHRHDLLGYADAAAPHPHPAPAIIHGAFCHIKSGGFFSWV